MEIWYKDIKDSEATILLGVGNTLLGKRIAGYLIEKLNPEKVGYIKILDKYSVDIRDGNFYQRDGGIYYSPTHKLFILTWNYLPYDLRNEELMNIIVRMGKDIGSRILLMDYGGPLRRSGVWGASTDKPFLEEMEKSGIVRINRGCAIGGLAQLLNKLVREKLRVGILISHTEVKKELPLSITGGIEECEASVYVLEKIDRMFNLNVDVNEFKEKCKKEGFITPIGKTSYIT